MNKNPRAAALAKIHIAKAQLGMADEDYRALLKRVAGVSSAADLLPNQADAVIAEMRRLGFEDKSKRLPYRRVRSGNDSLMAGIRSMLSRAARPWGYGDALAKRMCGIDRLEWCDHESLKKIHTALKIDERRRKEKLK